MSSQALTPTPSERTTRSTAQAARTPQACRNCKKRKVKCDGVRPTCRICTRRGQTCQWPTNTVPGSYRAITEPVDFNAPTLSASSGPSSRSTDHGRNLGLSDENVALLHQRFFETHHSIEFCGFIHHLRPAEGHRTQVPRNVELAILALSLIYVNRSEAEESGIQDTLGLSDAFASMAKSDLNQCLEVPTITAIQASLILGLRYFLYDSHYTAWMLVGSAIRMAMAIRLDCEPPFHIPAKEKEARRRTFWSCYIMDRLVSIASKRPPTLHLPVQGIQLPCPDPTYSVGENFIGIPMHLMSCPELMLLEDNVSGYNLISYLIVALRMWDGMLEIWINGGRHALLWDNSPHPGSVLYHREQAIVRWLDRLPSRMRWNALNYKLHKSLNQHQIFALVHLVLHHALCLVHQEYLPHWVSASLSDLATTETMPLVMPLPRKDPRVLDLCSRSADYIGLICRYLRTNEDVKDWPRTPFMTYAAMAAYNVSLWKQYTEEEPDTAERWEEQAELLSKMMTRGQAASMFNLTHTYSADILATIYQLAYDDDIDPDRFDLGFNEENRLALPEDPDEIVTHLLELCKFSDTQDSWTKFPKRMRIALRSALDHLPRPLARQRVFRKVLAAYVTYRWQHEWLHYAFAEHCVAPEARLLRLDYTTAS